VIVRDFLIKLQIWDFGGEERFRFFLPIYARGSSGGIFMYDITRISSLNNLNEWLSIFKEQLSPEENKIPILLVGGKKDLKDENSVNFEDAIELAKKHDIFHVIECSAKTGENVEKIFESIVGKIMKEFNLI